MLQLFELGGLFRDILGDRVGGILAVEDQEQQKVSELIGVIFDTSSAWETLTIGEMKAMINLALANTEDARNNFV